MENPLIPSLRDDLAALHEAGAIAQTVQREFRASRRTAAGLVGCALCFVPNHSHAALILYAPGLDVNLGMLWFQKAGSFQAVEMSARPTENKVAAPFMRLM